MGYTKNFEKFIVEYHVNPRSNDYTTQINMMYGLQHDVYKMIEAEVRKHGDVSAETRGIYDFLACHMPTIVCPIEEVIAEYKR